MSSLIVEICSVSEVAPHPNADRLDIATVKGWNCIVGRGEYKAGDLVVFLPPDSVLPGNLIKEYKLDFLKKGGKVGTLKLRGYISQGLVLPVCCVLLSTRGHYQLGDNVADVLGITKYEVPEKALPGKSTSKRVQNPNFSKYTDIENIQNFPDVFRIGDLVVITEKIHGSNIRFGWLPIEINFKSKDIFGILRSLWKKYVLGQSHEFVYGSHNVQLQWDNQKTFYGSNIYARVLQYIIPNTLPKDYIFYGEVYGKGVQELEYGQSGLRMEIFDIKNIKTGKYLDYDRMNEMCHVYGLTQVPMLYAGMYDKQILKDCTEGKSLIYPDEIREGCVVKSLREENHPKIGRKVLKSISAEYLARKNRTEYH